MAALVQPIDLLTYYTTYHCIHIQYIYQCIPLTYYATWDLLVEIGSKRVIVELGGLLQQ